VDIPETSEYSAVVILTFWRVKKCCNDCSSVNKVVCVLDPREGGFLASCTHMAGQVPYRAYLTPPGWARVDTLVTCGSSAT
jgi:hypothetical protein